MKLKLRRSHMKYLAIAGLISFFSVLWLLFSRLNSHNGDKSKNPPQVKVSSEVFVDDDNTDAQALSRGLRMEGQSPLKSVANGLWIVLKEDGLDVHSNIVLTSNVIHSLPYGSIVIGQEVSLYRATEELKETTSLTLQLTYPVTGFAAIRTSKASSSFNLKLLKLEPPVTSSATQSEMIEPPVNLCSDPSQVNVDQDYRGGDLNNTPNPVDIATPIECCELCYGIADCFLWTFTDSKQCWLKGDGARLIKMKPKPAPPASANAATAAVGASSGFVCGRSKPSSGVSHAMIAPDVLNANLNSLNEVLYCNTDLSVGSSSTDNDALLKTLVDVNPTTADPSIVLTMNQVNSQLPAPRNSHLLRSSYRTTGDWREQYLLGTGSVGLMVGGTLHYEVVPISIAGLFTKKAAKSLKPPPFVAAPKSRKVPVPTLNGGGVGGFNGSVFQRARTAFLAGQYVDAEDLINSHIDKNLGMFEYVVDLTTSYSPHPFVVKSVDAASSSAAKSGIATAGKPKPRPPLRNAFGIGRGSLLRRLDSLLDYKVRMNHTTSKPKFGSVVYSDHSLDLKYGVSRSQYLEVLTKPSGGVFTRLHTREWFASAVDDVAVNSASCQSGGGSRKTRKGCLNAAQMLSRDYNNRPGPATKFASEPLKVVDSVLAKWNTGKSDKKVEGFTYSVELSSSNEVTLSATVACGVILCVGPGESGKMFSAGAAATSEPVIVCNHADHQYHITSVVSTIDSAAPVSLDPLTQCLSRVNKALNKGISELRWAHMQFTSTHMTNTEVIFADANEPFAKSNRLCATDEALLRLSRFSANPSADSHLLNQLYQYGRFLALSSASQAVPNLQGVWADGVMAAWNGDYHLNINLQMMYWGLEGAGLGEMTIQPLRKFIQQMRVKGRETAASMYGAKNPHSWVGHGFTDSEMNMIIQAGAEWSLCVTCGAWVSLQLWEHLVHASLDKKLQQQILVEELIPTLRGVIAFFMDYAYIEQKDDGSYVVHTGPTTSPENSYAIVLNEGAAEVQAVPLVVNLPNNNPRMKNKPPPPKMDRVNYLTMSPAIDLSILRQVSNAYTLALSWLDHCSGRFSSCESIHYAERESDQRLAVKFRDFVAHMPNQAVPSVVASTVADPASGVVTLTGTMVIDEYPSPLPGLPYKLINMVDKGHRHFSVLHWLYPNTFLPYMNSSSSSSSAKTTATVERLLSAARETMKSKRDNGGGHTGWSAVWEACLYARLHLGPQVQESLNHLISKYMTSNLLTLHPPLGKIGPDNCGTCFGETDGNNPASTDPHLMQRMEFVQKYLTSEVKSKGLRSGADAASASLRLIYGDKMRKAHRESVLASLGEDHSSEWLNNNRGLVTARDDKFQLDANLGFLAAIHEMLVQSHIPGSIHLLPALPDSLSGGGLVRSVHLRGDVKVWMEWSKGAVSVGKLVFGSYHPWMRGVSEELPGFYSVSTDIDGTDYMKVSLVAPNPLKVFQCHNNACTLSSMGDVASSKCIRSADSRVEQSIYDGTGTSKVFFDLSRSCLPATVFFCDISLKSEDCAARIDDLFKHSVK